MAAACGGPASDAELVQGRRPGPAPLPVGTAPVEAPPLPLAGCPPPPAPPDSAPPPPPYVPPVLVPESELPPPLPPAGGQASLAALDGKGMWLWKYRESEGGNPDAIVARARAAGVRQLWVRVGDSADGFYARSVLDGLVPTAHRQGIAVIGWGFPYLFDPVSDARWSADALAWRSSAGERLDGFSPDIERPGDGTALSDLRVRVYLGLVRAAAGNRLVVATVYPPTDSLWPDAYPYTAIAAYVDAFAPMVYWGCREPGAAAIQAVERLRELRPVHPIGQAFVGAGGRPQAPDAAETTRFIDAGRRAGALGVSFWVWHLMADHQWEALSAYTWPDPRRG